MYTVSPELYRETAARLCDALDGEAYYSGSLEFPFDGMECRLVASVIVYRRREVAPEGRTEPIYNRQNEMRRDQKRNATKLA